MRISEINNARQAFRTACIERGSSFSNVCLTFVRGCAAGVDDGDDMEIVEARCFGEKAADVVEWLDKADCSNPRQYKVNMRKALYALAVLLSDAKTLGGLVSAYDKEWPTKKAGGKAGGKAKKDTITIEASKLLDLVVQAGLNMKEAERFIAAARKLAA